MAKTKLIEQPKEKTEIERARVLKAKVTFNESEYTFDDTFIPWDGNEVLEIHTVNELYQAATLGKVEVEAKIIHKTKDGFTYKTLDTKSFIEAYKKNANKKTLRESFDAFATDASDSSQVGQDNVPLLGGPFTKQLYYYDYLRMHSQSFYAYHHDPVAKRVVEITRDFVLGRGYKVHFDNPVAEKLWEIFEEVNDLRNMVDCITLESSIYGENLIWWLPNKETKIGYQLRPGQEPPRGIIPRVRLIDPSGVWDIVTYPEDITRVLFYYYNAPTQYQLMGGQDKGQSVPITKYIVQQIPSSEVQHYKINSVSNEKRGRSDLFSILGYLKRLRDSISYAQVLLQKQSAWSIDTTIEGNQADVDNYVREMESIGTIPTAGSEFAHTSKIKREYLDAKGGVGSAQNEAFDWSMNMIAAGSGIPVSYFGFTNSAAQTRGSALISTEPVAKKFQKRQLYVGKIIEDMAQRLFKQFGIESAIEVTFPEIAIQDRSEKLRDLEAAERNGWISKKRAAEIAAKELQIDSFNFEEEKAEGAKDSTDSLFSMPLTSDAKQKPSAIGSDERKAITKNERT